MSNTNGNGWFKWYRAYWECVALGHGNEWSYGGAFIAIVKRAQRTPTTFAKQHIDRGEFGFTYRMLERHWGKSHHTIKEVFDHFIKHQMIEIRQAGNCSILKVLNYDEYQPTDSVSRPVPRPRPGR